MEEKDVTAGIPPIYISEEDEIVSFSERMIAHEQLERKNFVEDEKACPDNSQFNSKTGMKCTLLKSVHS